MRVLTVGNSYPPHHHGGYELIWRSTVDQLRGQGHEVEILTTDFDTGATEPDGPGIHRELRWHLIDGRFQKLGWRERLRLARHNHRTLDRHLDAFRPDVVAWWSMGGLTLTMLETVRRREIPAVAYVCDEWLSYGRWADRWLASFTGPKRSRFAGIGATLTGLPTSVDFGRATAYAFISDYTRREALKVDPSLTRTCVIHSGIYDGLLDPAPEREWTWNLLYVGRIDRRKGIDTAIEALPHLPGEASLRIIGSWDTEEEGRLAALARELGVGERVSFEGKLDRPGLFDAYGECDVALFPVRWNEPWGLVPIEAMARGRAVIATGTGGSAEYLRDERNCLISPPDDERALAAAIRRLADSPDLRQAIVEGGIETASRYTESAYNVAAERALVQAVQGLAVTGEPEHEAVR